MLMLLSVGINCNATGTPPTGGLCRGAGAQVDTTDLGNGLDFGTFASAVSGTLPKVTDIPYL
jgi:hypothetical protein